MRKNSVTAADATEEDGSQWRAAESVMPFYAIVQALSGDVIDVTLTLDEALPPGAIAVELPGRWEDLPEHVRARLRNKAGGGGGEAFLDREEQEAARRGGRRAAPGDAEQFFARLELELLRAEESGRQFTVLLFEIAAIDRPVATDFARETLEAHGQELLPTDFVAKLRDHVAAALLLDVDGHALAIVPERGAVTVLTYAADRPALEALRRRKHPLLRPPALRATRAR